MFPANPFFGRGKTKKKKKTVSNPDIKSDRPDLPETPIPAKPPKIEASTRIISEETIPLQNDSTNRRMEDLDDDEYGYNLVGAKCSEEKERNTDFENKYIDAKEFGPYEEETHNPATSRFFYSPKGNYNGICVEDICQKINNAQPADQEDMKKFVNTQMLPHLKSSKKIDDIFTFLSCKPLRKSCIRELTEILFDIDNGQFSRKELMDIYEKGTDQLLTVVLESRTSKSTSLYPLIKLGIMFSCFIYLHAIKSSEEWIPCIQRVITSKQSKIKRFMDKHDPDIKVFAKTANCIFELENMELDKSMILGDETEDFLTEFKWESKCIYVEGLAALYHTGNLILREPSLLKEGVQRLVGLSSLMNESDDSGMVKWFHHLLVQFVVRALQQDYHNVKCETLVRCEDQLSSILKNVKLNPEDNDLLRCLLFSKNERVRSMYREIAKARGLKGSHAVTQIYIETFLLDKCGFSFEKSASQSQVSSSVERKLCKFCKVNGSITCFYDVFPEESADLNLYDNTLTAKGDSSQNCYKKENLENEFEVLKEIESKDFHENVARLLAFNQSFPKFYIKERLPGDNLQRRLLKARDGNKKIPIVNLIRIIIQAVKAVIYVHSQGCLIRDITTASYGCTVSDNDYFIKLKNFEMAAKPSDFTENGIVKGVMDLNFKGVPIRWAAPESLLKGHYSIYSDVWSVNILADEILNYAAWPYSDISDADIEEMVKNIVFTHLKPQGFNRPRRVQGLILEGLSSDPNQRLKLEALKERLIEILDSEDGGESCSLYDRYSVQEGCRLKTKSYYIPPLTEIQLKSNSVFERGIPESIKKFRNLDGDPLVVFHREAAEYNSNLKRQTRVKLTEISSNENYKMDVQGNDKKTRMKVTEKVTDEFQKFTYHKLGDIDSSNMCVKPWPPHLNPAGNEFQLEYTIPSSTHLLDIVLHKYHGETIDPYIQLLFELAKHVDSLHSAGWIFRCLRAKNVRILAANSNEGKQNIVVPKFGKYRMIFSPDIDDHLEQVKIENQEKEDVQWLPIEAIKAGLYSKESDVYAFGMITWEVMTAFGQEGVVYDEDEDQELKCIPFNYQESAKILQHLIKGYIPEKPAKCPDWFYQEITRPCLLHQKIDRPSMKTVIQILQTRLKKTIPKQINSISSTQLEVSNDANINAPKGNVPRSNKENERLNDRYENTSHEQFQSLPTSEPDTPKYIDEEMYENETYEYAETNTEVKDNEFPSSPCPSSYPEPYYNTKFYENERLSKRSTQQTHSRPPILLKGLPNVDEYDYVDDLHDERESGYDDAISLPKLTPFCLKNNEEDTPTDIKIRQELSTTASYYNTEKEIWTDRRHNSSTPNEPTDDNTFPVMTRANRDGIQNEEPDIHKKTPPVPRRKDSIHIPNTSVQTFENNDKEQGVKIAYVKPISPVRQKLDSVNSTKRLSSLNPKRTNDDSITDLDKNEYKTLPMYSNYGSAKNEEGPIPQIIVSENQSSDSKMRTGRRRFNISDESLQSVYKSSDFDATQSNVIHDEMRETFKGSDIVEIFSRSRGDSQERSNIDLTVHINKVTNVIVESSPAIQTTRRRVPPEPNTDPRSNIYVNEQGTEIDSNPTGMHVYVNEEQIEAKPPVPPRKPLNK